MSTHLEVLHTAFDDLYRDIGAICASCKDHDCEGYVWLLEEEATMLYDHGIPIVEINDGLWFIHSFEEKDGNILVDKPKPPCVWRKEGLCTIYLMRPLVCRMYPVGFSDHDGALMLVLHHDCHFSRQLSGEARTSFIQNVKDILSTTPKELLREITKTYKDIDEISAFPDGVNTYEIIVPIDEILAEGGNHNV